MFLLPELIIPVKSIYVIITVDRRFNWTELNWLDGTGIK